MNMGFKDSEINAKEPAKRIESDCSGESGFENRKAGRAL